MKKKTVTICLVVALLAIGLIGGTLAYFTDTEEATNTFTVGNVDIELHEPAWDPAVKQIANPGIPVDKDPYVENVGKNDAWVRVNVTVSDAQEFMNALNKYNITDLGSIFGDHPEADWTMAGAYRVGENLTYSYLYNTPVAANGGTTSNLFTTVTLPSQFDNEDVEAMDGGFTLTVTADAIQKEGFETAAEAFEAFDQQGY